MKSIANQYRDLQEGRISQFNFMRNLRMNMPQVTNTTSFGDAVKILKNKGIIAESLTEEEEVFSQGAQDENYDYNRVGTAGYDNVSEDDKESDDDAEFDAILKQLEDQIAGETAVKSDVLDEPLEEINENKEPKAVDENIEEVTTGIQIEHECYPDRPYDDIEKLVKKNIKKNPNYYTNYKLTGIRDYEMKTMDSSKPETHQMQFVKDSNLNDTAREMKKVKMPKAEEKKKLKEQVEEEAMRFQDLPADSETYKTVKDSKGKIIKATNAEGIEFQRGDEVTAYDGEKIKIADFKEEQGKIKALYNKGMFFATIDIDGLEAPKPDYMPGVNIGKSFEKFKLKDLKEMVRQAMAEMYDGRDNLDA
jgi:hypothetical protein